jgi:hypothetical protein
LFAACGKTRSREPAYNAVRKLAIGQTGAPEGVGMNDHYSLFHPATVGYCGAQVFYKI